MEKNVYHRSLKCQHRFQYILIFRNTLWIGPRAHSNWMMLMLSFYIYKSYINHIFISIYKCICSHTYFFYVSVNYFLSSADHIDCYYAVVSDCRAVFIFVSIIFLIQWHIYVTFSPQSNILLVSDNKCLH